MGVRAGLELRIPEVELPAGDQRQRRHGDGGRRRRHGGRDRCAHRPGDLARQRRRAAGGRRRQRRHAGRGRHGRQRTGRPARPARCCGSSASRPQTYTPPLVAGRRVFVQAADRTTSAWDGQSGRRLWAQQRTAENLVLQAPRRAARRGRHPGRRRGRPAGRHQPGQRHLALGVADRGAARHQRRRAPGRPDRQREPRRRQRLRARLLRHRRLRRRRARRAAVEQAGGGRRRR